MNLFAALPDHAQLHRLVNLRTLAILAQLLALLAAWKILELKLNWLPMLIGITLLGMVNFLTRLRLRSNRPVIDIELFSQLSIDVFVLSLLLYYAGGSTNPFISLYLLPLVIAAATLPPHYTWAMAALTTTCYSLLMVYHIPLPHPDMNNTFNTHVLGMWMDFVISAMVVAYFVVKMAQAVRSRDNLLLQVREEILRNERIVALGTQAAGAAHELGTPLSTMAVVIGEMQHEVEDKHCELSLNLTLLDDQIRCCRRILDKILFNAQDSGTCTLQAADKFIMEVLDEWQLLRPSARYHYKSNPSLQVPTINVDVTLRAALMNLLNNAVDASTLAIEINTRWDSLNFVVEIHDQGTGLSEDVALKAGSAFFTTKIEGRGLGLFLANATIERLGGTVRLFNRTGGGATTELTLAISVSEPLSEIVI